jgi:hypothetical protein
LTPKTIEDSGRFVNELGKVYKDFNTSNSQWPQILVINFGFNGIEFFILIILFLFKIKKINLRLAALILEE